jgi:hypothetical protein
MKKIKKNLKKISDAGIPTKSIVGASQAPCRRAVAASVLYHNWKRRPLSTFALVVFGIFYLRNLSTLVQKPIHVSLKIIQRIDEKKSFDSMFPTGGLPLLD